MRFKLDENLPQRAARVLAEAGHDASTVFTQDLGGRPDSDIAKICQAEQRTLITLDTDFADLRAYPPKDYPGLVVLCLHRQESATVVRVLSRMMETLQREPATSRLWILEEHRLRIRTGDQEPIDDAGKRGLD